MANRPDSDNSNQAGNNSNHRSDGFSKSDGSIEIPQSLVSPVLASWSDSTRKLAEGGDRRSLERRKTLVSLQNKKEFAKEKETFVSSRFAFRIDDYIPKDPEELKQTDLFQSAIRLVRQQRDQYLVGKEYADWQKEHRNQPQSRVASFWGRRMSELVYDPTALGHGQLATWATGFLPSPTMMQTATPFVASLPTTVLYPVAQDALLQQVKGRQGQVNEILRQSILDYLSNPDNRVQVKTSANSAMLRQTLPDRSNDEKQPS